MPRGQFIRASHTAVASLIVGLALMATACKSNSQAEVLGVWIPQAAGIEVVPKGDTVAVLRGEEPASLGTQHNVALAVARDVPWSQLRDLRKELLAAGRVPHLLVADGRKKGSLRLYDELLGEPIRVFVSVGGKLCVAPPKTPEAKCVQRGDKTHVDRAFTRELVREAVKGYQLHDVLVDVPADLEWGDVVRAVDGARTCCFEDKVRVRLK